MKCLPDDSIMTYHSYESLLVNHKNLSMNKRKFFFFVHSLALCWFIKQLICAIVVFSFIHPTYFYPDFFKVIHFTEVLLHLLLLLLPCPLLLSFPFNHHHHQKKKKKPKCRQSSIYWNSCLLFPCI